MIHNEKNAKIFKALCDPNRLAILGFLQGGEKCACELLEKLKIGQPTLSHHMRILCDSGLIKVRREGKWAHYSFDRRGVEKIRRLLYTITSE